LIGIDVRSIHRNDETGVRGEWSHGEGLCGQFYGLNNEQFGDGG
jgi:hypothetical protein